MSTTVQSLIKGSLRVAQALRKGEDPDDNEMQDALDALVSMLRSWSARRLLVRAIIQEHFPLTANQQSYTIGVGGNFNTTKPFRITGAFVRDTNNVDTGIDIIDREVFDSYQDKAISVARPIKLYYDPGLAQQTTQTGTIWLYYIPDATVAYTLYINSHKPFTDFTAIADVVTFDLPYFEAMKYELARRLWGEYHRPQVQMPPETQRLAREAMDVVINMNATQRIAGIDLPGAHGRAYNIYTGGYHND